MRFLVTGHAGFIGYHVSRRLLEADHQVLGVDGMTDYYDVALKQARVELLNRFPGFTGVRAMLEETARWRPAAEEFVPDVVIHLAAQAGVRYSLEEPGSYISSNLVGTFNILELARDLKPAHLMFASTSSVYGANTDMPFDELQRTDHPLSLYSATKKACESMAHSYSHLFGVPTTGLRFFTVYGPWGRPDMALFKFTRAILAGEPIDVYGAGHLQRDFTYVDDLVDAIVALAARAPVSGQPVGDFDSLSPVAPYRVVNIAGGTQVELLDYIAGLERALGRTATRNLMPMQPGDVTATESDPSLLRALTGTSPTTPVEEGVRRFVDWYLDYQASKPPLTT